MTERRLNDENNFVNIMGYKIYKSNLIPCVQELLSEITIGKKKQWLACINPHSYAIALNDKEFCLSLNDASILIPDGMGFIFASKILRAGLQRRITGSDIFYALNSHANEIGGLSVFFLGSTPDSLSKIRANFERDYPSLHFSGSYSPPFKPIYLDDDNEQMILAINQVKPDILWVGMTAPKQEKWIHQNLHRLDIKFAAAIGAVFDFYTGRIKRSHPIFQKLGLEWLPRLMQEPRRLWRRMFISAPIFIWHVIRARFYLF